MTRLDVRIAACKELLMEAMRERRDEDAALYHAELMGMEDARDGKPDTRLTSESMLTSRYQLGHRNAKDILTVEATPCST